MKSFKDFLKEGLFDGGTQLNVRDAKHAVNWLNKEFKANGSSNYASMRSKTKVELTDTVAGADTDVVDRYLEEFGGEYTKM